MHILSESDIDIVAGGSVHQDLNIPNPGKDFWGYINGLAAHYDNWLKVAVSDAPNELQAWAKDNHIDLATTLKDYGLKLA